MPDARDRYRVDFFSETLNRGTYRRGGINLHGRDKDHIREQIELTFGKTAHIVSINRL